MSEIEVLKTELTYTQKKKNLKTQEKEDKEKEDNNIFSSLNSYGIHYDNISQEIIWQDRIKDLIKPKIFSSIMSMRLWVKDKPTIMFFAWKSRTGKTLLARKIWEVVWRDYLHIPMWNFKDKWSLGTLLWATAWLKWYDDKLMLERYQNENSTGRYTLIFDEIEKADKSLESFFLELLDMWKVTLLNWKVLDFKNSVIIFTTNLWIEKEKDIIWFDVQKNKKVNRINDENIIKSIKEFFSEEFFNRIGWWKSVYVFDDLSDKDYQKILENKVLSNIKKIAERFKWKMEIDINNMYKKIIKNISSVTQENISNLSNEIEHQMILEIYK